VPSRRVANVRVAQLVAQGLVSFEEFLDIVWGNGSAFVLVVARVAALRILCYLRSPNKI